MFITMSVVALLMGYAGIYCYNAKEKVDYGWLAGMLGIVMCIISVGLPFTAIVGAFQEELIAEAIICILAIPLQVWLLIKFARSLWW